MQQRKYVSVGVFAVLMSLAPLLCPATVDAAGKTTEGSEKAIDPQQEDWPWYRGPFGNGLAHESAEPWIEDLKDAKVVWRSKDWIPRSGGTIRGGGGFSKGSGPNAGKTIVNIRGGHASLVMQDGRIYCYYFHGSEKPVVLGTNKAIDPATATGRDKRRADQVVEGLKRLPFPMTLDEYNRYVANIHGDDVMHCFDAKTGKTLWRTAVPGGVNLQAQSYGPHLTPTVNGGKVFAVTSAGRVIAWDAKTGKHLWTNEESDYCQASKRKDGFAQALEKKRVPGVIRQRFECAVAVDGVVAFESWKRGGICGIDAETGKMIWSNTGGNTWMLIPWKHDGKWYLLSGATLIDPKTGKQLWSLNQGIAQSGVHVAVEDDILVCNLTGYRISPQKIEKIWEIEDRELAHIIAPIIYKGHWYGTQKQGHHEFTYLCIDVKTGKVAAKFDFKAPHANGTMQVVSNGRFLWRGHSSNAKSILVNADPKDFRFLGDWAYLGDEDSQCPVVNDGRIYLRGGNHVWCYDMRK